MSARSYLDHRGSYNKKTKRWDQRQHRTRGTVLVSLRVVVTPGGWEPCLLWSPCDHDIQQIFSEQLTGLPHRPENQAYIFIEGKQWIGSLTICGLRPPCAVGFPSGDFLCNHTLLGGCCAWSFTVIQTHGGLECS